MLRPNRLGFTGRLDMHTEILKLHLKVVNGEKTQMYAPGIETN